MNCEECGVELTEDNKGRYFESLCRDCDVKHRKYVASIAQSPNCKTLVDLVP